MAKSLIARLHIDRPRSWLRSCAMRISGSMGRCATVFPEASVVRLRRQLVEDSVADDSSTAASSPPGRPRRGAPDPEMPSADHQLRRTQAALLEVALDRRVALGRFSIAALDGQ